MNRSADDVTLHQLYASARNPSELVYGTPFSAV